MKQVLVNYTRQIKLVMVFCILLSFARCGDEWLEVVPTDSVTDSYIWTTEENADMFLSYIYFSLPNPSSASDNMDCYSDNCDSQQDWQIGLSVYQSGRLNPLDWVMGPDAVWMWGKLHYSKDGNYDKIRKTNIFIKNVEESDLSEEYKTKRIAEARFLRAYFYHSLWLAFGGVPIITVPLNNSESSDSASIYYPRSTMKETFEFIDNELEEIYEDLPVTQDEWGRATRGAALAMKGFIELVYASTLRNPGNDVSRWEKAAATYKKIIDLGVYDLMESFDQAWLPDYNNCKEALFCYPSNRSNNSRRNIIGPAYVNNSLEGYGTCAPTQELVDAFRMANGKMINEEGSGYDDQNPYEGRESRFYQSIVYDGSVWQGDTIWTRRGKGSPNEVDNARALDYVTNTGYYTRKTVDESADASTEASNRNGKTGYIYWRYAEVLLSWAEAMNEAYGPSAEVIAAVDSVRKRDNNIPGIEDTYGSVDQEKLRELIRVERRLELAFEDKRYYDIIRWKIAGGTNGVMNTPMLGMVIEEVGGVLTYTPTVVYNRMFNENKHYYQSIEQVVIDRNPAIKAQNGGEDNWENGQNPGY